MEENWGIIGHQKIVDFFKKSLASQRLAQTYLFYGQSSLGKTTLAERFAEILLKTPAALVTDLYKVELLNGKQSIAIEQIREWRQKLRMKSFSQGYKVGLIYEAEKLNLESANALLKIIEEPTAQTVIILITSAWDRILPTILSRCQLIRFSLVNKEELVKGLTKDGYAAKEIEKVINFIGGYPGKVISYLKDQAALKEYHKLNNLVIEVFNSHLAERFLMVDKLLAAVKEFNSKIAVAAEFLKHFKLIFRNLILENYKLNQWQQGGLFKLNKAYSLEELVKLGEFIKAAEGQLANNVQPRLILENLLLNI